MTTNKKQFMVDFDIEIQEGTLNISDELRPETIFVLEDGTCVNAEYGYGYRLTDHHSVLSESGYGMDKLVTIDPESQTIILPDHGTTPGQDQILRDLGQVYNVYDIQVEYSNGRLIEYPVIIDNTIVDFW